MSLRSAAASPPTPVASKPGNFGADLGDQVGTTDTKQAASSQTILLFTNTRSRPSTAPLLCAASGHDAGQSLQPARDPRPLICPEETVAYSAI